MGELPEGVKASLALLDRNAERLRRLIDDLLECRRIEQGQFSLHTTRANLAEIVLETVSTLRDYASQLGVSIVVEDAGDDAWVNVDPTRIHQVVSNLISNAAKFSPEGGIVRVRLTQSGSGTVRVSVSDVGPGVPEAFRPMLFKKFAHGPTPANRQISSSGLGLSIVKALVEAHGGSVGFETEEGKGSTFHFDLPSA
jgi:signal transduction histidine kinase